MKTIILITLMTLLYSCSKDDDNQSKTTVTDADGNVYHTVKIGNQVWMVENLKTTKYLNGESIPNITDTTEWSNLSTGAYCDYDNNPGNSTTYGKLYNWYAVNDSRKIAPTGWHIPTDAEWETLSDYLGGANVAGGKLKEADLTHWNSPNMGATNETGFTALPGGYRHYFWGKFYEVGNSGYWWSATEDFLVTDAFIRHIIYNYSDFVSQPYDKKGGMSVRCVRN